MKAPERHRLAFAKQKHSCPSDFVPSPDSARSLPLISLFEVVVGIGCLANFHHPHLVMLHTTMDESKTPTSRAADLREDRIPDPRKGQNGHMPNLRESVVKHSYHDQNKDRYLEASPSATYLKETARQPTQTLHNFRSLLNPLTFLFLPALSFSLSS